MNWNVCGMGVFHNHHFNIQLFFYTVVQKHCVKNPYLLKYLSTMCFLYRSYVVDNQSDLSVLSWRNQNVFMLEMLKKVTSITKLNRNGEFPAFGSIFNYPTILLEHLLDHNTIINTLNDILYIHIYMYIYHDDVFLIIILIIKQQHYMYMDSLDVPHWPLKKPVHLALYLV